MDAPASGGYASARAVFYSKGFEVMKTWWKSAAIGLIALVPAASAIAGAEPDPLTPSDAKIVAQINIRSLLQAPLVQKHALDTLKSLLRRNDEVRRLLDAAGLDPLKDIDTIALSASGNTLSGADTKMQVVIRGNFTPDKARQAADEYARKHPGRLKSFVDGSLPLWEVPTDQQSVYAAFANDKTLVMTTAKGDIAALVQRNGQPAQRLSANMQAALAHLKGDEGVWLAMVATADVNKLLKNDAAKDFTSLTGALELSNDAQFALVWHTNSPKAAAQIKSQLDEMMPYLSFLGAGKDKSGKIVKELIDSIQLKTDKNDVCLRVHITDAQIEKAGKKGP